MLFAEREANIIELFQGTEAKEIYLLPETEEVEDILSAVWNAKNWEKWVDSSGKDDPPPDFFCDEYGLMMDVMRVDDHGYKKKGKIINHTLAKEHQSEAELRNAGILDLFPDAQLIITANTNLPTLEDHNFRRYYDNFKRTVDNHKTKIARYKQNHPGYKTIFFIFDESAMYCRVDEPNKSSKKGEMTKGVPHFWFFDEDFLSVFESSEIDYLIWFSPYKRLTRFEPMIDLPAVCIFDCKQPSSERIKYIPDYMMSTEE